jgi:hypothetical protein
MADDPLLRKLDALMNRHRSAPVPQAGAPTSWLPVLTDVVRRGSGAPRAVAAVEAMPAPAPVHAPDIGAHAPSSTGAAPEPDARAIDDTLAEQIYSELAPRLGELMEKQVAAALRKGIDETVSTLLAQLDAHVRDIVRETIAEKLRDRHPPSSR